MCTPGLIENDAQRPGHLGISGACHEQLSAAHHDGQWIVELMAGSPRKLAQCVKLALAELGILGFDTVAQGRDDRLYARFQRSAIGDDRRPSGPGSPMRFSLRAELSDPRANCGRSTNAQLPEFGPRRLSGSESAGGRGSGPVGSGAIVLAIVSALVFPQACGLRDKVASIQTTRAALISGSAHQTLAASCAESSGAIAGSEAANDLRNRSAVSRSCSAAASMDAQLSILPSHSFFMSVGVRRNKGGSGPGLNLGDKNAQPGIRRQLVVGRSTREPVTMGSDWPIGMLPG